MGHALVRQAGEICSVTNHVQKASLEWTVRGCASVTMVPDVTLSPDDVPVLLVGLVPAAKHLVQMECGDRTVRRFVLVTMEPDVMLSLDTVFVHQDGPALIVMKVRYP